MIRSTLFTLLLLLPLQGQDLTDEIIEADRIMDEAVADMKVSLEGPEGFVKFLEQLEEHDLLDLFLENVDESEKSTLVSVIEGIEKIEDEIDDSSLYARAKMGEELIDRVRTVPADLRRLLQLPGRGE